MLYTRLGLAKDLTPKSQGKTGAPASAWPSIVSLPRLRLLSLSMGLCDGHTHPETSKHLPAGWGSRGKAELLSQVLSSQNADGFHTIILFSVKQKTRFLSLPKAQVPSTSTSWWMYSGSCSQPLQLPQSPLPSSLGLLVSLRALLPWSQPSEGPGSPAYRGLFCSAPTPSLTLSSIFAP